MVLCIIIAGLSAGYIGYYAYAKVQGPFYGSTNSQKYHYEWCGFVDTIDPENLVEFADAQDAVNHGYVPCDFCDPPWPAPLPDYGIFIAIIALIPSIWGILRENNQRNQELQQQGTNIKKSQKFKIQKIIGITLIVTVLFAPLLGYVQAQGQYVGSINSDVYHLPTCKYVEQINPENRIWFASEQEAIDKDYKPCSVCLPDSPAVPEMPLPSLIAVAVTVSSVIILAKNKKIFQKNLL
jgi:methylphosphotriester-DNA--protein-cysteine methyltransferase